MPVFRDYDMMITASRLGHLPIGDLNRGRHSNRTHACATVKRDGDFENLFKDEKIFPGVQN